MDYTDFTCSRTDLPGISKVSGLDRFPGYSGLSLDRFPGLFRFSLDRFPDYSRFSLDRVQFRQVSRFIQGSV